MAARAFLAAAISALPVGLLAGSALGQTTADPLTGGWSQFQGNGAHSGESVDGPEPPYRLAWHAAVASGGPGGRFGLAAPIVVGDLLVAVGPEEVAAFEIATGTEAWSVPRTLGPPSPPALAAVDGRPIVLYTEGWAGHPPGAGGSGPTGPTPSVSQTPASGGAVAEGPRDSRLVAIDLETRERVWKPVELAEVTRSGVTVDGNLAFVADVRGRVSAVELPTGKLAWSVPLDRSVTTSLAAADGAVVATARGTADTPGASVVTLEAADGSVRWSRDVESALEVLPSAPAVADGMVVATFSDFSVRAYDVASGTERWTTQVGYPPRFPPVFNEAAVAISGDGVFLDDLLGTVYRLELGSGAWIWDFAMNDPIRRGAPVVSGGYLLVATASGSLNAFDPATGERVWRDDRAGPLRSITPAGTGLAAVRAGAEPGLDAFVHAPDARLVREASPTTPDYLRIVATFAAAALPLAAAALLAGRFLMGRIRLDPVPGPLDADSGADSGDDE